jgi:hypothetical protein
MSSRISRKRPQTSTKRQLLHVTFFQMFFQYDLFVTDELWLHKQVIFVNETHVFTTDSHITNACVWPRLILQGSRSDCLLQLSNIAAQKKQRIQQERPMSLIEWTQNPTGTQPAIKLNLARLAKPSRTKHSRLLRKDKDLSHLLLMADEKWIYTAALRIFKTAFMPTAVIGKASTRGCRMKRVKLSPHFESIMTWQPVVKKPSL